MLAECLPILSSMGLPCQKLVSPGRALVVHEKTCRYLLAKPMDVPAYVHYGAADLALSGSDVLMEQGVPLVELADTGAGRCRLVLAGPEEIADRLSSAGSSLSGLKVATKYPAIADTFFRAKGLRLEIIHMHGSVELSPLLGISDFILDIVQSGETLRANGLKVLQEVANISLRVVANRQFTQKHWETVSLLVNSLDQWKGRKYLVDKH
jgi:ATP phosphoribosyltransferase